MIELVFHSLWKSYVPSCETNCSMYRVCDFLMPLMAFNLSHHFILCLDIEKMWTLHKFDFNFYNFQIVKFGEY